MVMFLLKNDELKNKFSRRAGCFQPLVQQAFEVILNRLAPVMLPVAVVNECRVLTG